MTRLPNWGQRALVSAFVLASCTSGGKSNDRPAGETEGEHEGVSETHDAPEREASVAEEPTPGIAKIKSVVRRTPELCPHAFKPSLAPLDPPKVQPRNRAQAVQIIRRRIERVEVVELSTYRVLFSLDEESLEALRQTPTDRPINWRPNSRPASLPPWEVALLVYVAGKEFPYLGHFFDDGDLYFVDEEDPWDPAVFDSEMNFRGVYGIPTDGIVDDLLTKRLGEHDPFGQIAAQALRIENARCLRISAPHGDPFPDLPKAIIEPVDDPSAE